MINKREYGIVFVKGFDCGIAKISVFDSTTSKYITSTGEESSTPVFQYCDLYQPTATYSTLETYYCYWISLEEGHNYTITAINSGLYNAASVPPYNVNILKFLYSELLITEDNLSGVVTTWHEDFSGDTSAYQVVNNTSTSMIKTQTYNGDGSTLIFALSGANHAEDFEAFSIDSGATWRYPSDLSITWGSNIPDYDDETMDSSYHFSIKFIDEAPPVGTNNVIIKFRPLANKVRFNLTLKQPHDELNTYKDYRSHVVVNDYALEFIQ